MNFDTIVLGPQYRVFGADATLKIGNTEHSLRVITRMPRAEAEVDVLSLGTIKPRAMCRRIDLDALGITLDQLKDSNLTVNGLTWLITSARQDPGPAGKGTGEIIMNLRNDDL